MSASRSLRPNEVPVRQAPDCSLNGHEKVVAKNGPFSLTFCQIVALMFPHRNVIAGRFIPDGQEPTDHFDGHAICASPSGEFTRWHRDS